MKGKGYMYMWIQAEVVDTVVRILFIRKMGS